MAEAAEEKMAVPVATGVPLKLVIMIVVGTLVLGLAGAFVLFRMTGSHNSAEASKAEAAAHGDGSAAAEAPDKTTGHAAGHAATPGIIADMEPFIVNLADAPEIRYLKLTVKLDLDRAAAVDEVKQRTPQIRDSILVLLTSKDSATIRTPQGKAQLRDEITQRVNGLLPKPAVRSAYFTEFVIQ
ncbi:MAG TPA: flagellar basal body-associated FliL family protein [Nitrospiraceae bacterium]|nr:flagellar basal body-associated FliL family protein [Nitrospiraceae bacterium]